MSLNRGANCKTLALFLLAGAAWVAAAGTTPAAEYKISPLDKLRVKVYEWPALTDEVVVGSDGLLHLPVVGEIRAAGASTSELARSLAEALRARAKLSDTPFASVEVVQYQPFYVLGDAQRPGEYPYRPGLTVAMALSVAGGAYRREQDRARVERDVAASAAAVEAGQTRRRELLVRLARLRAEQSGKRTIELGSTQDHPPNVAAEEGSILAARIKGFENQTAAYRRQIELFNQTIQFLKARAESGVKQQASVEREIAKERSLADRGLALAPRLTTLERLAAQIEGDQRDIDARISQTRQEMAQAEAAITKLVDDRERDLRAEIRATTTQLEETNQQIALHHELAAEAEALNALQGGLRTGAKRPRVRYRITRSDKEFPAQANDNVEPRDVLVVEQYLEDTTFSEARDRPAPPAPRLR